MKNKRSNGFYIRRIPDKPPKRQDRKTYLLARAELLRAIRILFSRQDKRHINYFLGLVAGMDEKYKLFKKEL